MRQKQTSVVEIVSQKGGWYLSVNGQPFYIKGMGCDYLNEESIDQQFNWCREIGANAIRHWGHLDYDSLILEKCEEYNLMALMGFRLPETLDYISDEYSKKLLLEQIEKFINKYKNYPSLLMWGIGNEVIDLGEKRLKEKGIKLTDEEREIRRIEFAKYLQRIYKRVHEIDPNHPILYAGAVLTTLKYFKEYTPDLDIYGINFFAGGAPDAYRVWKSINKANIPYVFTEFGNSGPWEVGEDVNDQPIEHTDKEKAEGFKRAWKDYILRHKGYNLGGFAFFLTEKKLAYAEDSPTWWGVTYNGYKNASFWALRELYSGKKPPNYMPIIKKLKLSKTHSLRPNEVIRIKGKVHGYKNYPLRLEVRIFDVNSSSFLEGYSRVIRGEDRVEFEVPPSKGLYRIFLFATDGEGNIASANKTISVGKPR